MALSHRGFGRILEERGGAFLRTITGPSSEDVKSSIAGASSWSFRRRASRRGDTDAVDWVTVTAGEADKERLYIIVPATEAVSSERIISAPSRLPVQLAVIIMVAYVRYCTGASICSSAVPFDYC